MICSHLAAPFSFSEVVAGGAPIAVSPTGGPQDEIRERMLGSVEPVAGLGWRDRDEVCVWVGGWVVGWVYVGVYLCTHVTFLTDVVCVYHIMPLSSLLLVCSQHALPATPL